MTSLAGSMRRRGMSPDAIEAALSVENRQRCQPPLARAEVAKIAASVGRYESQDEAPREWPEPQPLPEGLAPVDEFGWELAPATLRPWMQDISERIQCAPDYVAVAGITALGALIGRKLGIRPQAQTDWTVTGNQWALLVGRPGVLKSPAMEAVLSQLRRLAARAVEAYQGAQKDYATTAKLAKLRAEAGEKAARAKLKDNPAADVTALLDIEEPEAPTLRRYVTNNTTAEALGELLRQNPNGLLVHRDEMVSLLRSLDREDSAEARGFYLTAWNGDSAHTFDRIGRGLNLHVPAVSLSLLGSTQPGRIAGYIRAAVHGGARDDGLIQRFGLLVWPDTGGAWRDVDRWPDSTARKAAAAVFDALDKLDPLARGARQDTDPEGTPEGLPYVRFDAAGLTLFREWRADLEARLRADDLHPALESHLAKYRKLIPGLALIIHLADGGNGDVGEQATLQALGWAEYLESHAQRAYGAITAPEGEAAAAILYRLRRGDLARTFRSWEVWRPGWAHLTEREAALSGLRLLVDLGWLIRYAEKTPGRTATVYEVNPRGLPA